jgi:hypothetical protein
MSHASNGATCVENACGMDPFNIHQPTDSAALRTGADGMKERGQKMRVN